MRVDVTCQFCLYLSRKDVFHLYCFFLRFDCLHHFKKFFQWECVQTWRIHKIYFIKKSHSFTNIERKKKVVCFSLDFDWNGYSQEGATTKYVWLQWIWMENCLSVFGSNVHSSFGEFYANDMLSGIWINSTKLDISTSFHFSIFPLNCSTISLLSSTLHGP